NLALGRGDRSPHYTAICNTHFGARCTMSRRRSSSMSSTPTMFLILIRWHDPRSSARVNPFSLYQRRLPAKNMIKQMKWSAAKPNRTTSELDKDTFVSQDYMHLYRVHGASGHCRAGYTDVPDVDENDNLLSRRTTPVHHAARKENFCHIEEFFKIYNRLDVNYTDEFGFTHFHAACMSGNEEIVKKFLELGWSPNYHGKNSADPPLHLAIKHEHKKVIELLLRSGADQNLANTQGSRPLHIICQMQGYNDLVDIFFKINHELNNIVEVDAQDDLGNTPLHLALYYDNKKEVELLLRRGANPNLVNDNGLTPLHIISRRREGNIDDNGLVRLFFKINDERKKKVQVNVVDTFGRTPLQLAVANVFPHVVDLILNHGADLDSFVFPKEKHFAKRLEPGFYENCQDFKLRKASGILIIVERLEKKGFKLDRVDALTIIKLFTRLGLFEEISVPDELNNWTGQYPDLGKVFRKNKIDSLLVDSMYHICRDRVDEGELIIKFVARSGYKNEPEVDKDGKPLLRCTTAVHHTRTLPRARNRRFAVALRSQARAQEGGRIAAEKRCDPNLADVDGLTHPPLHIICMTRTRNFKLVDMFFKINDEINRFVQVDIRNSVGQTLLHFALHEGHKKIAESLLRRGLIQIWPMKMDGLLYT
ncbi:unnamed protein product, partial [Trichogramma brassicae]